MRDSSNDRRHQNSLVARPRTSTTFNKENVDSLSNQLPVSLSTWLLYLRVIQCRKMYIHISLAPLSSFPRSLLNKSPEDLPGLQSVSVALRFLSPVSERAVTADAWKACTQNVGEADAVAAVCRATELTWPASDSLYQQSTGAARAPTSTSIIFSPHLTPPSRCSLASSVTDSQRLEQLGRTVVTAQHFSRGPGSPGCALRRATRRVQRLQQKSPASRSR